MFLACCRSCRPHLMNLILFFFFVLVLRLQSELIKADLPWADHVPTLLRILIPSITFSFGPILGFMTLFLYDCSYTDVHSFFQSTQSNFTKIITSITECLLWVMYYSRITSFNPHNNQKEWVPIIIIIPILQMKSHVLGHYYA